MNLIDVLIPLVPGVLLVAFPQILIPKTAPIDKAARMRGKLRKVGYLFIAAALVYSLLILAQGHSGK